MGGYEGGDVASQLIVNELCKVHEPMDIDGFAGEIKACLQSANQKLRQLSRSQYGNNTIGSTVAVLASFGQQCAFLWVGDSRIYRLRHGQLKQVTRDHSVIEDYIENGMLTPEQATASSMSNVLTRAVGIGDTLEVDCSFDNMRDGDIYLLCSDGLYREVTDEQIIQAMSLKSSEEATNQLLHLALEHDAKDNITALVVQIE